MPVHDWTRVLAGVYHAMHNSWITHLQESLNAGVLPGDYYALGEQRAGNIEPDVVTLRAAESERNEHSWGGGGNGATMLALVEAPPKVSLYVEALDDIDFYLQRQRAVVVRRASGDRVVAFIEIVSPANKHSQQTLDDFVDKIFASLREGVHELVIDPLPPGRHDPSGIHRVVWDRLLAEHYEPPPGRPLTMVSDCARRPIAAWIEPLATGQALIDMPSTCPCFSPPSTTCTCLWNRPICNPGAVCRSVGNA